MTVRGFTVSQREQRTRGRTFLSFRRFVRALVAGSSRHRVNRDRSVGRSVHRRVECDQSPAWEIARADVRQMRRCGRECVRIDRCIRISDRPMVYVVYLENHANLRERERERRLIHTVARAR